ncbi:translation initiation factor IF-2-like [Pipra filicauda]|uniref:Translation initiation factor IF-2-like n=1 Tax=Pipra filicauda TaxID=649802 RepID=A0A7R5KXQ7_9PASS|nr:translation initiation factor IF-2-like [Pipra filicauda]
MADRDFPPGQGPRSGQDPEADTSLRIREEAEAALQEPSAAPSDNSAQDSAGSEVGRLLAVTPCRSKPRVGRRTPTAPREVPRHQGHSAARGRSPGKPAGRPAAGCPSRLTPGSRHLPSPQRGRTTSTYSLAESGGGVRHIDGEGSGYAALPHGVSAGGGRASPAAPRRDRPLPPPPRLPSPPALPALMGLGRPAPGPRRPRSAASIGCRPPRPPIAAGPGRAPARGARGAGLGAERGAGPEQTPPQGPAARGGGAAVWGWGGPGKTWGNPFSPQFGMAGEQAEDRQPPCSVSPGQTELWRRQFPPREQERES